MAVAIRQTTTPAYLLTRWQSEGWHTVRSEIVRQIPGDEHGNPTVALQLDAFEWIDVAAFGFGNTDEAIGRLREHIQDAGSDLWAYTLFTRTDVDFLGVKVVRYRLLLCHSIVQLLAAAVLILVAAFAAVIFWQYVTTGQAPALRDLQNLWGGAVSSVGAAAGEAGSAIAGTYLTAAIAVAVIAGGIALAAKSVGTKPPRFSAGSGSIGVRTAGISARAST